MELFHANAQWSNRPADERFTSLEAMHAATKAYADKAAEAVTPWGDVRVESVGDNMSVTGKSGVQATLTHYAFGQLSARADAPAHYLRQLPGTLAAQNLNYGLKARPQGDAKLLFHQNGGLVLRAATSDTYARVWNHEVIARLIDAANRSGLVPARPTFRQFSGDAPALYASDHDMFAFLMSAEREIKDPTGASLFRGVIAQNSEVGDCALKLMGFYFRDICGNHIIWGAREIAEVKLSHVGRVRQRWADAMIRVRQYMDGAASLEEAKFREASQMILPGTSKDEILDAVFGSKAAKSAGITRKALAAGYDAVVPEQDGPANNVWSLVQGFTRASQATPHADDRTELDRQAGKLLQIAF